MAHTTACLGHKSYIFYVTKMVKITILVSGEFSQRLKIQYQRKSKRFTPLALRDNLVVFPYLFIVTIFGLIIKDIGP